MIKESFVFLPRIGERSERNIWSQGVCSWDDFKAAELAGFSVQRKEMLGWYLDQAKRRLRDDDASYFGSYVPFTHQWRLWDAFKHDALFLDIETTGYYGDVTVVGLYDGEHMMTLVRGHNLDTYTLRQAVSRAKLLVTFNGKSFDVPVLKKYFHVDFDMPHIDLRFVCQRLGWMGGLKAIEKRLDLSRADLEDVSGADAVALWHLWRRTKNRAYLEKLLKYNELDVVNLLPLAERLVPRLWVQVRYHSNRQPHSLLRP